MSIKPSQSGRVQTVEAGTTLNVVGTLQIGGTAVTSTAAELNAAATGGPASITFSPAAGSANVCEVTVTIKNAAGATLAGVFNFDLWLSDAATGAGLTATTASGAVAAKASSGADLAVLTTKKAIRVQTLATGIYILSITDTAKTLFYVAAQVPGTGKTVVSSQLATGNYG